MPFVMDKFKSKKGASVSEEFALSRIYVQNKAFFINNTVKVCAYLA